ncbi:hypothetical protein [Neobacillus niacini]|uniref:hypothetical protein n=1 Tax=Neobacillus niacini TaxID=86668 RepID=UPI00285ABC41|nr:hypothetical protein [Neobacillus niacini]MDR7001235.1 hypothetical protein [Neobacillus niacini]
MSLSNPSLGQVVKKQFFYKLKAYQQVFITLVIIQIIAVFFSFNGIGEMGSGSQSIDISIRYYSADMVVGFTFLWAFITAINLTTKAYRYDDFAFVTNRVSSNLSNILFLLAAGIIGGVTSMLSASLIKVMMVYFKGYQLVASSSTMFIPSKFLLGIITTSFYIFLFCALGYFVGMLVQIHKIFIIVLPVVFLGIGIGKEKLLINLFAIFFTESSPFIFVIKIIATASLLFYCSVVLSNRMEVRS